MTRRFFLKMNLHIDEKRLKLPLLSYKENSGSFNLFYNSNSLLEVSEGEVGEPDPERTETDEEDH